MDSPIGILRCEWGARAPCLGICALLLLAAGGANLVGCSFDGASELGRSCFRSDDCGDRELCTAEGACVPDPGSGDRGAPGVPARREQCSRAYPADLFTSQAELDRTIVIGGLLESDRAARHAANAVELALREVNAAGGIGGVPFGLVVCEIGDPAAPEELSDSAAYLASLGAIAVVGPSSSSLAQSLFAATGGADGELLLVSPGAESPVLTGLEPAAGDDNPGRLWRTALSYELQGRALAHDRNASIGLLGIDRVAVVAGDSVYDSGARTAFVDHYVGEVEEFELAADDVAGVAAEVSLSANDAIILLASDPEQVARFVAAYPDPGLFARKDLYVTAGGASVEVLTPPGGVRLFGSVRGSRPQPVDVAGARYRDYAAAYRSLFGVAPAVEAVRAYDAAWLVTLAALSASSGLRPTEVTTTQTTLGLRNLRSGPPVSVGVDGWTAAFAELVAGGTVDVEGLSSRLDYHSVTEELRGEIELWGMTRFGGRQIVGDYSCEVPDDDSTDCDRL